MDPKEYELFLATIAAMFTGAGAFYVSVQELWVHQEQVAIERQRLLTDLRNSAVEAADSAGRAAKDSWELERYQCDAAREIYAVASPNPTIPANAREALSQWAAQKLLECTK